MGEVATVFVAVLLVGGGLGRTPMIGKVIRDFLPQVARQVCVFGQRDHDVLCDGHRTE